MPISDERLPSLLAYCQITDPDPYDLITLNGLYDAAAGYLTEAGVAEPAAGTPRRAQYNLLVNALVLDGWDLRGTQVETAVLQENPSFRRMLNQLKMTEMPAEETETTTETTT